MLTFFCVSCSADSTHQRDIPLVAVLRDNLGTSDPEDHRILFVWLLAYARPGIGQQILSAVPFFYWAGMAGSQSHPSGHLSPILDSSAPEYRFISGLRHDLLQSEVFDQMRMPVRAISRERGSNELDDERIQLEETIAYLKHSPVSDSEVVLTQTELDSICARLQSRKELLGGLGNQQHAIEVAAERRLKDEQVRSRNWELLREWADKTGLIFEPVDLGGGSGQYAVLWLPLDESSQPVGSSAGSVWKLLNIKNPWTDQRLRSSKSKPVPRWLDENGTLLPAGASGAREISLLPLGFYSLSYPRSPLLLVDFRDQRHLRSREVIFRATSEVIRGVLGLSHFTNWYCYLALDLYEFVIARRGSPVDGGARLDCYARFRVDLALDHNLDPAFRKEVERRAGSLIPNPLTESPDQDMQAAGARYAALLHKTEETGAVMMQVRNARRSEIAAFNQSMTGRVISTVMYGATFGLYTHRAKESDQNIEQLQYYRRVQYQLDLLDSVVAKGTTPEVAYQSARLDASIAELSELMTRVESPTVRAHFAATLRHVSGLSQDSMLKAECSVALAALKSNASPIEIRAGIVSSRAMVERVVSPNGGYSSGSSPSRSRYAAF